TEDTNSRLTAPSNTPDTATSTTTMPIGGPPAESSSPSVTLEQARAPSHHDRATLLLQWSIIRPTSGAVYTPTANFTAITVARSTTRPLWVNTARLNTVVAALEP